MLLFFNFLFYFNGAHLLNSTPHVAAGSDLTTYWQKHNNSSVQKKSKVHKAHCLLSRIQNHICYPMADSQSHCTPSGSSTSHLRQQGGFPTYVSLPGKVHYVLHSLPRTLLKGFIYEFRIWVHFSVSAEI